MQFDDLTKINSLIQVNLLNDDSSLIQRFGTILILELLYGSGTNQHNIIADIANPPIAIQYSSTSLVIPSARHIWNQPEVV
jgi:hypothetical protein